MGKILVLNSGSSSLKYKLFEDESVVVEGVVAHIGEPGGVRDHAQAFEVVERELVKKGGMDGLTQLDGVGHRVVHGGERFVEPVLIDEKVIAAIEALIPLAPLHNPANLKGIEMMVQKAPNVPQVAVFDTAFHQSMPEEAWRYAIPGELYDEHHIRRYGFHGTSHAYVANEAAALLGKPLAQCDLITLHLGNGASACAIKAGRSVDTSMGFTPLEGLVMGTRSGDLDPAVAVWMTQRGMDADTILNKRSGLMGLCGDNDVRRIEERAAGGDEAAKMALKVYIHRIRHYIGAYFAILGRLDALVFTAGVGEHSALVRQMACEGLHGLGIELDTQKNLSHALDIATDESPVRIFTIATDEELAIARQTAAVLNGCQQL